MNSHACFDFSHRAATVLLVAFAAGCSSSGDKAAPASTGNVQTNMVDLTATQFRAALAALTPQIDRTMAATNGLLTSASSDPHGAVSRFQVEFNALNDAAQSIRAEASQLQQMGSDQYFMQYEHELGASRNPTATQIHAMYQNAGGQMIDVRMQADALSQDLDAISSVVMGNPSAAGIQSVSGTIAQANSDAARLKATIANLQRQLDQAHAAG
jgi:hypothetical protein